MKPILIVGNLQTNRQANPTIADVLLKSFLDQGWYVIGTSRRASRVTKLVDMLFTVVFRQHLFDIAIVDVYSGLAFIWAECVTKLLWLLKKKYVLCLHGGNLPEYSIKHAKRISKVFDHAALIISPSEYLQKAMGRFNNKIKIIPNPINIRNYRFTQRKSIKPVIVWMRAFHRIYNPLMAVQVINRLHDHYPDVELIMIGPDKQDGSLQEVVNAISENQLNDQIKIIGSVDKDRIPDILQQGDIFINTTNVDNTPVSVIEAMACGLCIVSTNVGGLPYLLKNDADALLVPPNDIVQMSDAIINLLKSPDLAQKISSAARKKAEKSDMGEIIKLWDYELSQI